MIARCTRPLLIVLTLASACSEAPGSSGTSKHSTPAPPASAGMGGAGHSSSTSDGENFAFIIGSGGAGGVAVGTQAAGHASGAGANAQAAGFATQADLVDYDCVQTLLCMAGSLDVESCVATTSRLLDSAEDQVRAEFRANVLRCKTKRSCEYVDCVQH